MSTKTLDYWKHGYVAPSKENNFQNNMPTAYEIELHHSSDKGLEWHYQRTILSLAEKPYPMIKRELEHQLETILAEYAYRGIEPAPYDPRSAHTQ